MAAYNQGGHFYCRTRVSGVYGNENDKLEGEKKVRDFIWQYLVDKKLGYTQLSCPGTDTGWTTHYFIESNEIGVWNIAERSIYQSSDDKIIMQDTIFNSFERFESKDSENWFLIIKSADTEVTRMLPVY